LKNKKCFIQVILLELPAGSGKIRPLASLLFSFAGASTQLLKWFIRSFQILIYRLKRNAGAKSDHRESKSLTYQPARIFMVAATRH
jgi:hypothetical protein